MSFSIDSESVDIPLDYSNTAQAPHIGQFEGFKRGLNASAVTSSQLGLNNTLTDKSESQYRALIDKGVTDAPRLSGEKVNIYSREGGALDFNINSPQDTLAPTRFGGTPEQIAALDEYDNKILRLRELHPDLKLKTSDELVADTIKEKRDIVSTWENSKGGAVGGFFGEAASSLNPKINPLNFATLPVGGTGKTVLTRIATQVGAQGAIEAVNQVTGVQSSREFLGLPNGLADAASSVGYAMVGGAVVQGAGEALVSGAKAVNRKWFNNTPNDPAPDIKTNPNTANSWGEGVETTTIDDAMSQLKPPSAEAPSAGVRMYEGAVKSDADYVVKTLDDWGSDAPALLKPSGVTDRLIESAGVKAADGISGLDAAARQVDPKAFDMYDLFVEERQSLSEQLQLLGDDKFLEMRAAVQEQVDAIYSKLENPDLSKRQIKIFDNRLKDIEKTYNDTIMSAKAEGDVVVSVRQQMQGVDKTLRDLSPAVARAYAHAKGKWSLSEKENVAVKSMMSKSEKALKDTLPEGDELPVARPLDITDKAPILQRVDSDITSAGVKQSHLESAVRVVKKESDIQQAYIDKFADSMDSILSAEKGELTIPGLDVKIDIDAHKISVLADDGESVKVVTFRQLIEEALEANQNMKAVKVCSI
jgi:hypothetical protein